MKVERCAICGKVEKLTFEHVPPKTTFNSKPIKSISGIDVLGNNDKLPWDLDGYRYKNNQRGSGYMHLCADCNNYFGKWYVPSFAKFVNSLNRLVCDGNFELNTRISVELQNLPTLAIFKQVMSMFCTINNSNFGDNELSKFLLDKDSTNFNKMKYKICFYYNAGKLQRFCPLSILANLYDNTSIMVSEIGTIPLGFILYMDPQEGQKSYGTDITSFAFTEYDKRYETSFSLNILECNSLFPDDFRTKLEIVGDREKSIAWVKENQHLFVKPQEDKS